MNNQATTLLPKFTLITDNGSIRFSRIEFTPTEPTTTELVQLELDLTMTGSEQHRAPSGS